MQGYRLGSEWVESGPAERDLKQLNVSQLCSGGQESQWDLACINNRVTSRTRAEIGLSTGEATPGMLCAVLTFLVRER